MMGIGYGHCVRDISLWCAPFLLHVQLKFTACTQTDLSKALHDLGFYAVSESVLAAPHALHSLAVEWEHTPLLVSSFCPSAAAYIDCCLAEFSPFIAHTEAPSLIYICLIESGGEKTRL